MKSIIAVMFALLSLSCAGGPASGKVVFVSGDVLLVSGGRSQKLTLTSTVTERDSIITAADGVAVVDFPDAAIVEVQQNSAFEVRSVHGAKKHFYLPKGNVWTKVNKLTVGSELSVETPRSLAAVRGTKFYTFTMGDIHGTCHCEGVIDYKSGNYSGTNDSDFLVFTKNGVSIVVKPSELAFAGMAGHDHSACKDSPLGKCPSNVDMKKVTAYLDKRFAAAKKTGALR